MELNLEQIKAAAMAATPGPWLHYCPDGAAVNPERAAFVHGPSYRNMDRSQGFKIEDAAHIAAANPAAVLALIEEVERLSAIVEKHIDPKQVMLTGLNVQNGSFDLGLEGGPVRLFAAAFAEYFKESPASNYIEMQLGSTDPEIGDLVCTLQRKQGKTPHALRREAERERDGYKRALLSAPPMPAGVLCKGSMALGSGCGLCERCRKEMGGAE